jgi:SAM-dependent methyltransferase
MVDAQTEQLRRSFDGDATLYDRARPGYPAAVFDSLADLAKLPPKARVLEIGCGTGKATVPLAERGYRVTAVELGADLAAVARRHLAAFPDASVVVAPFETWPLPPEPFHAVVSATAFHWLDPAVRVTKCADALSPGGSLAIISTHHVAGGTIPFFHEAQECYEKWMPGTPPGLRLQAPAEIPMDGAEIIQSGLFDAPVFGRYEWDQPYSTAAYLDVLMTYSGHRTLAPDLRQGLFECITGLIETRYGGAIVKRYMTELLVARKVSPAP